MMNKHKLTIHITALCIMILSVIACEKDANTLASDVINSDNASNFNVTSQKYDVITYTNILEPVQTNGLPVNSLGIYDDTYGRTTARFLTQLTPSSYEPDFGDEVVVDSVVLSLPYYSTSTDVDDDGNITYEIDSVFGSENIKLSIYESNYFIRDFDPNGDFNDSQMFFSNQSASPTETILDSDLEGQELVMLTGNQNSHLGGNIIEVSEEGFVLYTEDEDGEKQISQRQSPGIRVLLDKNYWESKIIDEEDGTGLSSPTNFADYFKGLYFKAEPNASNTGSFLILNTASTNANITIYYTRLTASTTDDADATEQATYVLNFGSNRINFLDKDFTNIPLTETSINPDPDNGDARLYLKGGEGAIAKIKLFGGDDDDDDTSMVFDDWKNQFVGFDEDGKVFSKRLINEANLVFHVDQNLVNGLEPNRLYIYDAENNTVLIDYLLDASSTNPENSIANHLGPLQRVDDEVDGEGIKYKLKITEHLNNLILRDSTNVELGLAVSLNVNLENSFSQPNVLTQDDNVPMSSIVSPRGTVLHGNATEDTSKKVYLEIYYTEPNN